ncbi:MAG: hypothetical protein FJ403_16145 [Verrucomicrobia bacterium]|nr:hypothetical protein [Verrucomicrobiota bacterium]
MKTFSLSSALKRTLPLAAFVLFTNFANAQPTIRWEAFNDYRPTDGVTSPNATGYDLRISDDGGVLKDIKTGNDLPVSVIVVAEGDGAPDDFGALSPPDAGSPADKLFKGKVDLGNSGLPGIRASANVKLILNFKGLDASKRYNFRGTVARGGSYNDRWSFFGITGADAYVTAHEDGSNNKNIITKATFPAAALATNQVALNTGHNKAGSLVGWDNIEPGADGTFSIEAQQYTGAAPFGNPSAAPYGYGFNAIYLAEIESTGALRITENPANQILPAGTTATLKVVAGSPQAITYQWQKAAPGSSTFADIAGATQATYITPLLTVADSGAKFRARISSGASQATSGEATINVDGVIPTVSKVAGSINFNSVYVTFSEPMKLDQLAKKANYAISGLTIDSVVALDSANARLLTSKQTQGTPYTVTINNIEDVAGNKVTANSTSRFNGFTVQTGVVGLEIWKNITGGAVQNLRDNTRYPNDYDVDYVTTTLDSLLVVPAVPDLNTYGGRFRAWLTPEESGQYEFFVRADDQGELRISLDDKFDNLDDPNGNPDAADTSAGDTFQEPGLDNSTSAPIQLERGRKYALQAIWKEGNGGDYLQVAWRKVGNTTTADQLKPIPSKFLSYYGPGATPVNDQKITVSLQTGRVTLSWASGTLQSSDDLKAWKDEAGVTSPLSITPAAKKFYRVRN